jgi:hypothetical protein
LFARTKHCYSSWLDYPAALLRDDGGIQQSRVEDTMDSICRTTNRLSFEGIGHHWTLLSLRVMPLFQAYAETGLPGALMKGLGMAMHDGVRLRHTRDRGNAMDSYQNVVDFEYSDTPWV